MSGAETDFDLTKLEGKTITAARIETEHDEYLTLTFSDGSSFSVAFIGGETTKETG